MAFSDLCHIGNAYKTVENESDQSERIMEENSMVRDLITKILDETGPAEGSSSSQSSDKAVSGMPPNAQYLKSDANASFMPPYYQNYNYGQSEQNGFNFNLPNGFGNNFVNYTDNDALLGLETDSVSDVSPEQLNLLRLAAQEIGGAQFSSPKYDDKYYNFFEPSQRNSLPEANMFPNNFNRNSLNLDMNYNNYDNFNQRFPNKFDNFKEQNQDTELLAYLSQLNLTIERDREPNNMEFKLPLDNGPYQNEEYNKMQENKMFFNRNFQPPPKNFNGEFYDQMSQLNDRNAMNQNFDYSNQTPNGNINNMNFKPNGYHQNEFMPRRDMNVPREYQNGMNERNGFNGDNQALMRQQELARQMSLLIRNRPPPNQLNVDVSFLPENAPFNLGLGGLLASGAPPVLPSPMLDLPLLAPFYALRNMRGAATSSGILHLRLDACYEQWRQLERERKRTEARLALAYPGRAVSSSNSIPVPRLPPCPTRVDRLTVDMLREHTKVLTLMGKMETLRASVCVAQNKKPVKEDSKITVLKRGEVEKEKELDPETFDPSTWKEDVNNLAEIAPHSEVESAMLSWRAAVGAVQAARRRELAQARHPRHDPILQLAEAVKQLCQCARRARAAMWSDLTLTVALAPQDLPRPRDKQVESPAQPQTQVPPAKAAEAVSVQAKTSQTQPAAEAKEQEKQTAETTKPDGKQDKKQTDKQPDKNQQRRAQYYRKVNQRDFYQKNHRYDNRFMHNRHPYYLATGPIN